MVYIGIPTVNLQRYLEQTINSIVMELPWRLLLVDNLSTDGTREWIQNSEYQSVLNPANFGVAKSWNQIITWAMSHDDCDAIYMLNNDIVLHPEAFNKMNESLLEKNKEVISGLNIGTDPEVLKTFSVDSIVERYSPNVNFSCFGLVPETVKRVGLFDEAFKIAYFEDNDYHTRLKNAGIGGSCDQWAWFSHYGSRTIKEGGVKHSAAFENNKAYFKRKWGWLP